MTSKREPYSLGHDRSQLTETALRPPASIAEGSALPPRSSIDDGASATFSDCVRAARAGDADAQFQLGLCLARGEHVAQHTEGGLTWCHRAATRDAQLWTSLGLIFEKGGAFPQDPDMAVECSKTGSSRGVILSMHQLAMMYLNGLEAYEFTEEDFPDVEAFCNRLRQSWFPVAQFIFEEMSDDAQDILLGDEDSAAADLDEGILAVELTEIVETKPIYTESRFAGVALSPRTRELLGRGSRVEIPRRLNRFLLEDAFAGLVRSSLGRVAIEKAGEQLEVVADSGPRYGYEKVADHANYRLAAMYQGGKDKRAGALWAGVSRARLTGESAGLVAGGVVEVPGSPPFATVYVQMVAWDGRLWGSSLPGVPPGWLGRTDIVTVELSDRLFGPPALRPSFTQPAVVPIPEPSALAFIVVGGVMLLFHVRAWHPRSMKSLFD